MEIPAKGLRLNLGCGRSVRDGWYNVDAVISPRAPRPPDLLCDVRKIPLPDSCATDIEAIHLWEHLYRWECDDVIVEWRRLLRPGGLLVMEMPDLFKACQNVVDGRKGKRHPDQLNYWALWGDPRDRDPLMVHHWGWTFTTLAPFLAEKGFTGMREEPTQYHSVGREYRDFRIVARKATS